MHRGFGWWCAAALVASLVGGSAAMAAPPSWSRAGGHGSSQATQGGSGAGGSGGVGGAGHGHGTAPAGPAGSAGSSGGSSQNAGGSHGAGSSPGGQGSHGSYAQQVSTAVSAARQAGERGSVLAYAVHQVQLTERPDNKGLQVAEAVYQSAYPGNSAGGTGNSPFADLPLQAPWALGAVDALQGAGVIQGTSATTFTPNAPVTLAELATMLARLQAGSAPGGSSAPQGTPPWAAAGMGWAQAGGILSGVQGLGAPSAALTRAQAVLMLLNAAGLGPAAGTLNAAPLSLQGTPPAWAHGAFALAVQLGLIEGSGGQLLPDQSLTRAQMAVILARLAVLEAEATSGSGSGSTG